MSPGNHSMNNQKQEQTKNQQHKPWGWERSDIRIVTIYYPKCPVFNKKTMKHAKKQENFRHVDNEKQPTKFPWGGLDLVFSNDFKSATINMFKELEETVSKVRTVWQQCLTTERI